LVEKAAMKGNGPVLLSSWSRMQEEVDVPAFYKDFFTFTATNDDWVRFMAYYEF
jgi:hypothetical protein